MIILDASCLRTRSAAHEYLKEQLQFPAYYGKNLDALYDCLTQLDETEVEFVNLDAAAESYFTKVLPVFQEAEESNRKLHLFYRV